MHTPLLLLEVRRKRDALRARRHARQLAALLGFEPREQACVAALVFEMTCQLLNQGGKVRLRFGVDNDRLLVMPALTPGETAAAPLRIEKLLPRREPPVSSEDLGWILRQLNELAPVDVFEEVKRQNQDVLRLLLELQALEARLTQLTPQQAEPTAA
ncbi:MAG TPA: hypothetical protein VEL76_11240 [Gemmataceae bacterium]|nr:hypothetical protein [Gemmataceae bacterium]